MQKIIELLSHFETESKLFKYKKVHYQGADFLIVNNKVILVLSYASCIDKDIYKAMKAIQPDVISIDIVNRDEVLYRDYLIPIDALERFVTLDSGYGWDTMYGDQYTHSSMSTTLKDLGLINTNTNGIKLTNTYYLAIYYNIPVTDISRYIYEAIMDNPRLLDNVWVNIVNHDDMGWQKIYIFGLAVFNAISHRLEYGGINPFKSARRLGINIANKLKNV